MLKKGYLALGRRKEPPGNLSLICHWEWQGKWRKIGKLHFSLGKMEPVIGVEPMTCCLRNSCSTTELHWRNYPSIYVISVRTVSLQKVQAFKNSHDNRERRELLAHFWVTDKLSVIREVLAAEFSLASPSAAKREIKQMEDNQAG